MKTPKPLLTILLLIALSWGCTDHSNQHVKVQPQAVATADSAVASDTVYVDVRTKREFDGGHVAGALHIPYDETDRLARALQPYEGQQIVLYCRSGRRSGIALKAMQKKGFTNVENGGGLLRMAAERNLEVAK